MAMVSYLIVRNLYLANKSSIFYSLLSICIAVPEPPKKRPKILPQEPEILNLKRGRPNFNYGTLNDEDFNENDYIVHSPDTVLINDDTVFINDDTVLTNDTPAEENPESKSRNAWMKPIVEEMMIVGNKSLSIMRMVNQVIGKYFMSSIKFGFILS